MPLDPIVRLPSLLRAILLAIGLAPSVLAAQDQDLAPATVQVSLAGFTLAPDLTETGAPVLDEAGEPVILRLPLDESVITPGDQVVYVITLDNPTEEPAMNLQIGAQVAAELLLDPYSITGPEGLAMEWADEDEPTNFRQVFAEIDGETIMQADLDSLRALRLTLPELLPSGQASLEYTVTLR